MKDTLPYRLEVVDGKLTLFHADYPEYKGFAIDFADKVSLRRLREPFAGDPLRKSFGPKSLKGAIVWDLTLGLGRDAFQIARMGADIYGWERSRTVLALWEDAQKRARKVTALESIFARIHGREGEGQEAFGALAAGTIPAPDFIYLDPMYPEAEESGAKRRKEMVLLRAVAGADSDAASLFSAAKSVAAKRVVVKRPLRAKAWGVPDVEFRGKSHRFDVYVRGQGF